MHFTVCSVLCTSEAAGMTGRHTMSSMPWRVGPPSAGPPPAAGGVGFPVFTKLDHIVVSFLDSSATRINHINKVLKVRLGQIASAWEWYHWIDLEKDQLLKFFDFLISVLNIWKDFKVLSRMNPTSCSSDPFFLLAGALLFVEKIRQRAALFWFGLWDVGIFYSQAVILRTIVDFPVFLEHGSAEKISVCAHTNRDPNKQEDGLIVECQNFNLLVILRTSSENLYELDLPSSSLVLIHCFPLCVAQNSGISAL